MTVDQLKKIATGASSSNVTAYIDALNETFIKYKMDGCLTRAHFLAQILEESGQFSATLEAGGRGVLAYDPWRGRGLIQLTYEKTYKEYGDYAGIDVTSSLDAMRKLGHAPHSVESAGWYFSIRSGLVGAAEADDFLWITRSINGAYTGHDHRLEFLNRAIDVLGLRGCIKLNRNGRYLFEESRVYSEKRGSCAWGMWNDPGLNKGGIGNKSVSEAMKGYRRYLDLDDAAGRVGKDGRPDSGWYGLRKGELVRPYVENRVRILGGAN